jgi:hypothetical protein
MDAHFMNLTVVGYEVSQSRQFDSNDNAFTRAELHLSVQGTKSPRGNRTTRATIIFGKPLEGDFFKIGHIEENVGADHREAELSVTLPATEFDNYWNIITHAQQPHVFCTITPHNGVKVEALTLATAGFDEAVSH